MTTSLTVIGVLASTPPVGAAAYLALLTACSARVPAPVGTMRTRFDLIVPAHDEATGIAETIESLAAMDYPSDRWRVLVVADNCTDDTACRAAAMGARVLERNVPERRGKGYALELAYGVSLAEGFADAVVVIDADSSVTPNLLRAFDARFEGGADAVQAEYGVRNAGASWRTRLMALAFSLFHTVRSLGRERLGLSCGLRGNGMAFSTDLLRRTPPAAYSLVEDVEYGIAIGVAGTRVMYAGDASVLGDMPVTAAASRSQRARWEQGRWALLKSHLPSLWRSWRRGGGRLSADLAADLLVPPLTTLIALIALGVVISIWDYFRGSVGAAVPGMWILAVLCLVVYVCRGLWLVEAGPELFGALLWVPVYATWKFSLAVRDRTRPAAWVRTARAGEAIRPSATGKTEIVT